MHRVVARQGGELFTLIFPVDRHDGGPPYAMDIADVRALLERHGFRAHELRPAQASVPERTGLEWVGRWYRAS